MAVGIAEGAIDGLRVRTRVVMEVRSISTAPSSAESARALSKASDPRISAIEVASSSPVLSAMLESGTVIEKDTSQITLVRRRRRSVFAALLPLMMTAMEKSLIEFSEYLV